MNELRVISGLHRGVSLPLDGDVVIIGSSFDADIALVDPGITDQHIKIETSTKLPKNCWNLIILDGKTWDEKGNVLTSTVTAKIGNKFNIAGIWIMLCEENTPWPSGDVGFITPIVKQEIPKKSNAVLVKIYSAVVGILIGIVTLTHAGSWQKETTPRHEENKKLINDALQYEKRANTLTDILSEDEYISIFNRMLKERNLEEVKVTVQKDGWLLSGAINTEEKDKLQRMILRYNSKYGEPNPINNQVEIENTELPFSIVKIISGPMGHIEADDGHKLYVGNSYKGMKLVGIKSDTILFTGKNNIEVKW